jgi:hypothetical protein
MVLIESGPALQLQWPTDVTVRRCVPDDSGVYVNQHEYALIAQRPDCNYVGSDDATTCVILVLVHTATETVYCAHLDSEKTDLVSVDTVLVSLLPPVVGSSDFAIFDAHLFGGMDSSTTNGVGARVTACVLRSLQQSSARIMLRSCITGEAVPSGVRGAIWDMRARAFQPAAFDSDARGPALALRSAAVSLRRSAQLLCAVCAPSPADALYMRVTRCQSGFWNGSCAPPMPMCSSCVSCFCCG